MLLMLGWPCSFPRKVPADAHDARWPWVFVPNWQFGKKSPSSQLMLLMLGWPWQAWEERSQLMLMMLAGPAWLALAVWEEKSSRDAWLALQPSKGPS